MPPINLSLDAKNNLILSVPGATLQLVEVEPGLLTDPDNANVRLVLHTDEAGQAYILSSDPWAYVVPWYGTTGFRDLMIQRVMLLFLCSLIGWSIVALMRLRKISKGDRADHGQNSSIPSEPGALGGCSIRPGVDRSIRGYRFPAEYPKPGSLAIRSS